MMEVAVVGWAGLVDAGLSSGLKSVCAPVSKSKKLVLVKMSKLSGSRAL